ncbi:MAG: hypothetical protein UT66_C0038G0002 [candidate division CPR2 bacterium GW2011_GWC1_39_9]|uniref:Uncharacterized protein n=1 Tax=candidate division CPR2 bacterium GW2011_GWC2_39_10 TaxID=1618345 RepID=A0A0G0LYY9_UNCC2|nr:MAG: hypothetical protein UT18_C0024G0014 [candidate division CPR2 bacterium GW2011_GWC2_39_10]KKR33485.1 MAG: hypothetical protein UT66_C0038G0002 [candidate division CPR2 bacterium GW2011_GWC1_39_9]
MTLREFFEKMIEAMLAFVYLQLGWDIERSVGIELDVMKEITEKLGKKLDTTQFFRTDPNNFAMKTVPLFMYTLKLDGQPITEEKIKNELLNMALSGISANSDNSFIDDVGTFFNSIKEIKERRTQERQEGLAQKVDKTSLKIDEFIKTRLDVGEYRNHYPYAEWHMLSSLIIHIDEKKFSKILARDMEKIAGRILDGKPSGLLSDEEKAFKDWYAVSGFRLTFEMDRLTKNKSLSDIERNVQIKKLAEELDNIDDKVKKQLALQFGESDPERIEKLYQIMQQAYE